MYIKAQSAVTAKSTEAFQKERRAFASERAAGELVGLSAAQRASGASQKQEKPPLPPPEASENSVKKGGIPFFSSFEREDMLLLCLMAWILLTKEKKDYILLGILGFLLLGNG